MELTVAKGRASEVGSTLLMPAATLLAMPRTCVTKSGEEDDEEEALPPDDTVEEVDDGADDDDDGVSPLVLSAPLFERPRTSAWPTVELEARAVLGPATWLAASPPGEPDAAAPGE
jgi:hypothetical protein